MVVMPGWLAIAFGVAATVALVAVAVFCIAVAYDLWRRR